MFRVCIIILHPYQPFIWRKLVFGDTRGHIPKTPNATYIFDATGAYFERLANFRSIPIPADFPVIPLFGKSGLAGLFFKFRIKTKIKLITHKNYPLN